MDIETISRIFQCLVSVWQNEVALMEEVNQKRGKLIEDLSCIEDELEFAENEENEENSSRSKMQKLKDAFYLLTDILDNCSTEITQESERCFSFFTILHPSKIMFRHSMVKRMEAVEKKLGSIDVAKNRIDQNTERSVAVKSIPEWRKTTYQIRENEVEGRREDVKEIIKLLEDSCEGDVPFVLPIVGMGGLGKTTLVKLVYTEETLVCKQEEIRKPFDLKLWVCVGEYFDEEKLIKGILASAHDNEIWHDSNATLSDLKKELQNVLEGKQYLLVLDDMWNDDQVKWERLKECLAVGSRGSSVLITTRQRKIADMMAPPNQSYNLDVLTKDDCWKLFSKYAFQFNVPQTEDFVKIGKEILAKCKGVPLAIKTVASFLSFRNGDTWWHLAKDSKHWKSPKIRKEDSIFAALRLSYLNLSAKLRRCFSYCAVFPKGHQIKKEDIIHLWMANGLISCEEATYDIEYVGEERIDDLYWRSLIQDIKKDEGGSIDSFKVHDLVHDLAQSIMGDECHILSGATSLPPPSTRHFSINFESFRSTSQSLEQVDESLRTFINFKSGCSNNFLTLPKLLEHTCLRALDLSMVAKLKLPPSIGVLKLLRYMNLSQTDIESLPHSICSLWNLQILKLNDCKKLIALPQSMGHLKKLRHLYLTGCWSLTSMPWSISQLTALRTLSLVIVGNDTSPDFKLSQLGHLNHLRGNLTINHLERVTNVKHAEEACLVRKDGLRQLTLKWEFNVESDRELQQQIFEVLQPAGDLKELEVTGYEGCSFPTWMMNDIQCLGHIKFIQFSSCKNISQLPPLWKLPYLKKLCLDNLDSLTSLIGGQEVLPLTSLQKLTIHHLPKLEKMISREGEEQTMNIIFPYLSYFEIYECPTLASLHISGSDIESFPDQMLQGLKSLKNLSICGCSQIKSLPKALKLLSSLETLSIQSCLNLVDISNDTSKFSSLRKLCIADLPVVSLDSDSFSNEIAGSPEDIQPKWIMQEFELFNCPKLMSLPNWLSQLVCLEKLCIKSCPNIVSLPNSIEGLKMLAHLSVISCPELLKKCERETGEEWHKISHVQEIILDS